VRQRRARGAAIDGVLLLDKPRGITSQTAVSRVKNLYGAAKAGHTGTLDPLAGGLLPVCLGEATKFAQGLLDADKGYLAVIRLGVTTTTGDLEGDVLTQLAAPEANADAVSQVLVQLRGDIMQVPPMYSALKRNGKPLYEYARAGQDVPREPRKVHIGRLVLEEMKGAEVTISVTCSKGTYVRVLAEDLGKALGCGACLASLTRVAVGNLRLEQAISLAALSDLPPDARLGALLPPDALVSMLPRLDLDTTEAACIRVGRPVVRSGGQVPELARAYGPGGEFMGLAGRDADGRLVARRLVSSGPEPVAVSS
jgi:tRNA pseudouridine55 synthase